MTLRYAALDIETCPLPLDDLQPAQLNRLARRVANVAPQPDETDSDVAARVRATDPALLWICCIGAVSTGDLLQVPMPKTYTAAHPDEEAQMLADFWRDMAAFSARYPNVRWVSFNGKTFDVPRLLLRSAVHGLEPVPCGLLDTYPYRHRPHCDLQHLLGDRSFLSLDALCAVLGVASPKEGLVTGDGVAAAVEAGAVADVATYCAADVAATLACYARLVSVEAALTRRYS